MTVIDVARRVSLADRTVSVAGDRIVAVAPSRGGRAPAGAHVVDARGAYLIPGLWDLHVHAERRDLPQLVAYGVTATRDMGGDLDSLQAWRRGITAGTLVGPRLWFAGPRLAGPPATASDDRVIVRTPADAQRAVDSLAGRHVDFLKVWDGIPRAAYFAVARDARAHHLAFAGHVPAAVTPAEASDAGQRSIEHLEFVPKPCLASAEAISATATARLGLCGLDSLTALFQRFARNGTWVTPTLSMFRHYVPAPQAAALAALFGRLAPVLRASDVRLLVGTDLAGGDFVPGASLHEELERLVAAGYRPAAVLRAATWDAAHFVGAGRSAP